MARISTGRGITIEPETSRNIEVSVDMLDGAKLEESIKLFKAKHGQGIVGVIVNSIQRAIDISAELSAVFGEETVTVNHSRFVTTDRLVKDSEVLNIAGKESNRDTFNIVVGTQVLEQSLDIDFDILYSDIAPVASLIQRMGRLHRHERPNRNIEPRFVILREEPSVETGIADKTAKLIYGEWLISVSEQFFENNHIFSIPENIESAVEWLPENYSDNHLYIEFTVNAKNLRKKKTRDFTLKRPPAPRPNKLEKTKQQSLHGCFSITSGSSAHSKLLEAKVRDIDRPNMEIIAIFEGEDGGVFVPVYEMGERKEFYLSLEGEIGWEEAKSILSSTIRLPFQCSTLEFVEGLENRAREEYEFLFSNWQNTPFLKGELFAVFSKDCEIEINNIKLKYSHQTGLEFENV